ncbi:hypothetical protein ACFLV7_10920 [Chloroflexota bacterium]
MSLDVSWRRNNIKSVPEVTFYPFLREERGSEHVRYGSSDPKEPLDIPVEQFLSMIRFESKGKLDDLGLEIDATTPKSDN